MQNFDKIMLRHQKFHIFYKFFKFVFGSSAANNNKINLNRISSKDNNYFLRAN